LVYKSVCKTRFGTKFFQAVRACENNCAAQAVVTDPEYAKKYEERVVQGRRASETDDESGDEHSVEPTRSLSEILEENKRHITSSTFWRQVHKTLELVKPAVELLKLADSDRLMSGKIYSHMCKVHSHLVAAENADEDYKGVADIWYARWQRMHHSVYCMCHVLHPDHNESNPLADAYVNTEVKKCLKSFFPVATERHVVHAAILRYLGRQGHFSTLDDMGDERPEWSEAFLTTLSPWQWWSNFASVEPVLSKFAMRVLQLAISSSACERVFSKWAFVVHKYRTRLSLTRQMKSIYCFANWRLVENCGEDKYYRSDSDDEEVVSE